MIWESLSSKFVSISKNSTPALYIFVFLSFAKKFKKYKILAFTGASEKPPRVVDERIYNNKSKAYHAIFLMRINDLLES